MRVQVPLMFGIRMCFQCPFCNVDEHDGAVRKLRNHVVFSACACQSIFGSNAKLMGGYAGLGQALCFANENQVEGTLHGHGFVALSNAYQHVTLEDIVNLVEQNNSHAEQKQHVQRIFR